MSRTFATPLRLEIDYPAWLVALPVMLHLSALGIAVSVPAPLVVRVMAVSVVITSAYCMLLPLLRRDHARRVCRGVWHEGLRWTLYFGDGREETVNLTSPVEQYGPVLRLRFQRTPGGVISVLLCRAMLDAATFRKLHVRVCLQRGDSTAATA